ncbi:MAG: hypothetical protein VKJ04_04550 [Vampirovibrionales bacterium]|nr:hypothetical protein [Vampirovibrionales bacterium]
MTPQFPSAATGSLQAPEVLQAKSPLAVANSGRPNAARNTASNPAIRFGQASGPLAAFSSAVDLLQNKAIELAFTDLLGMSIPRSYIEYEKRGWDSARENAIREVTGMLFNVFVAGWIAYATTRLMVQQVGQFNPLGVNHRAWLDRSGLEAFSAIYEEVLQRPEIKTPEAAERAFTAEVLKRLQSTDAKVGRKLVEHSLGDALKQNQAVRTAISQSLAQDGKLAPETLQALSEAFHDSAAKVDLMGKAIHHSPMPDLLLPERLRLSQTLFSKQNDKHFLAVVDELAKRGGLTDRVHLLNAQGGILLEDRGRADTLKQVRYFLHEVLNRAHHDPSGKKPAVSVSDWKQNARAVVYSKSEAASGGFWAKHLPQAEDGLIEYMRKSKNILTVFPLALTVILGISVAFINNHITKKRHGGKVFSPIEEGLRDKMRLSEAAAQPQAKNALAKGGVFA